MTVAEKVQSMAGFTPSHTKQEREDIRSKARKNAKGWFALVLDHHKQVEDAFAAVKQARTAAARAAAQEYLAVLLTGHSNAEEFIVYPFMKLDTSATDAKHVYSEQAVAKMEMVALDTIPDKMSKEYETKLEKIRSAVEHHMIEEERDYFPDLQKKANKKENDKIMEQYTAEFNRYLPDLQR